MSNEIKYVNEAGVRRIVTDTRARLTDLTTDVDSAFGFSLDLSDIDTTLQAVIAKTISFNLPKEFSTDEYDIFAKVHLSFENSITGVPPYYVGGIPVIDGAPDRKKVELLVPITGTALYTADTQMKTYQASQRYTETITGKTVQYLCHCKSAYAYNDIRTSIRFSVSEGLYSLKITIGESTWGLLTHIYGTTSSANSYTMTGTHTIEYTDNPAITNITVTKKIEAIEILVRKKLEATAE